MITLARRWGALLTLAAAATLAGGCATVSDHALRSSLAAIDTAAPRPQTTTAASGPASCGNQTASLRPRGPLPAPGRMPAGSSMRAIQDSGRLVAGVDQNTLLLAYLNPFDGQPAGFEIDLLHELARAIFGDPRAIEFKAISSGQRIGAVQSQSVDLVADAMTINCARVQQVAFSSAYFNAGQRVLVPNNSGVRSTADLGGRRVCATRGSTSIEQLARLRPRVVPVGLPLRTDCLVALQQGAVDAISTDDAILFGLQAQDPYTTIVGPRFTSEAYGIAINRARPDLVRFVNAVLERMRADGTWSTIYQRWIGRVSHQKPPPPPQAHYRD